MVLTNDLTNDSTDHLTSDSTNGLPDPLTNDLANGLISHLGRRREMGYWVSHLEGAVWGIIW